MRLSIVFLVFCILTGVASYEYFPKFNDECDTWADRDGECVNNFPFMWAKCHRSCIELSRDDNDNCEGWAEEGECTNNPHYIQIHCPRSCQLAISWSPWVRNTLGLEVSPYFEPNHLVGITGEPCGGYPVDIFSAAKIVQLRLQRFMAGEYKAISGFSVDSPNEYLGMLGLAEAILYCLRNFEVVLQTGLKNAEAADSEGLLQQTALNKERIDFIVAKLRQGYASDPIMRALPNWVSLLDDSAMAAHAVVAKQHHSTALDFNYCTATRNSPQLQELVPYFLGKEATQTTGEGVSTPDHFTLHNGVQMPSVGLGTWLLQGRTCYDTVLAAITAGYRSIDTAEAYQNEANVGDAIKAAIDQGLVLRRDLFIATKLSDPTNAGYETTKELVRRQLSALQTSYVDLYMLHSPIADAALQAETWRALEDLLAAGTLRAIGVSNFGTEELQALIATAKVRPMVVQNKVDVYHVAKQLDNRGDPIVKFARENGILMVAYSSFSAYPFVMKPTDDPIVRDVARRNEASPAQVILKWSLQKGFAVIPRSSDTSRLQENLAVLNSAPLSQQDMLLLDTLQLLVSSPVCMPGEQ